MMFQAIRPNGKAIRAHASAFATTVALLAAAAAFTWWAAWRANREACSDFLRQVRPIARAVNVARIRTLSGSLADREHVDYRRLKEQLDAVCLADPAYRYVYLLGRRPDGAVFFFVGTGLGDEAEPGDVYDDAPDAMGRVFDTGVSETVGPYSDRWGTFVSGLVPITDAASGAVVAVLGVDIDAQDWRWDVAADTALPVGMMLVVAVLLMAGVRTARGPAAGAPKPIQRRLLAPLAAVFLLLIAGFGFALASLHQRYLSQASVVALNRTVIELRDHLTMQADALAAIQAAILRDESLRHALKDADRERLLANWGPAFAELRDKHGVTHFYFFDPSRTCFLRLHSPEKHGDLVDRATALKAERTGAPASGIELGPLGTFTLRVVAPVFDGGELVGYLELGKEIEDGLAHVRAVHGVEIVVDIRKSLMDRRRWEAGMTMLGRDAHWDRFPDDVVIYSSLSPIPVELGRLIEQRGWHRATGGAALTFGGKSWHVQASPLRDASDHVVGDLLVLRDVTEPLLAMHRMMGLTAGAAVVLLAVLHAVVHLLLRRTDADIMAQQAALRESEAKYRELVENAGATICAVTREGVLTYASPNWTHLLGHAVADVEGTEYGAFVHPDDAPVWAEVLRSVFALGRERTSVELRMRNAERECFWHAVSASPVFDQAAEVVSCIVVSRDITHRKTAELALRESEQRLAATLRSIGDAVIACDREGRVRSLNPVAETLTGWSNDEAAGRPIDAVCRVVEFPFRGPIEINRLLRGQECVMAGRHAVLKPRRGAEFRIALSGATIRDDASEVLGVVLVFRDISEETRRSDELFRSERLLQAIVDGSPIPQFVIDRQHRVTHWNAALATYSGIAAQDILGTTDAWRAFYDQERPCMADLVVEGAVNDMPTWYGDRYRCSPLIEGAYEATGFFRKEWGGVWLDFTAAPLRDAEGAIIGAVETLVDVTQRKEAESHAMARASFSAALNQVEADAVYHSALQRIAEETGAPVAALFVGDAASLRCRCAVGVDRQLLDHQRLAPDGLPLAAAETGEVVVLDGPFDDMDLRVRVGVGEVALQSVAAWPVRSHDRTVGVLLTALTRPLGDHDVESLKAHLAQLGIRMQSIQIDAERNRLLSELRSQARVLERAKGEAERAALAKSTFLAHMSHEFRTPMNSILGFTARLAGKTQGEPLSARDLAAVEIIDRNARELLEMINGILALSRIEAGKSELAHVRFDLREAIRAVVERVGALAVARGLDLAAELPDEPLVVEADRVKIVQVVNNLVANAVKYTEKGRVCIAASLAEDALLGKVARVAVRDTGIGIKQEDLDRVFTMFTRLDAVSRVVGTGLGLPVAQQYARMHGGRIDVWSEFGKGSEFVLVLPWEPLPAPAGTATAPEALVVNEGAIVEMVS